MIYKRPHFYLIALLSKIEPNSVKMYRLGLVCILAVAAALPVLPDPPSLPGQAEVKFYESTVSNNVPKVEQAPEVEHEEKKDENEAEEPKGIVIMVLPEPPLLPPLDESILREIIKQDEVKNSDKSKDVKEPSKDGDIKKGESENDKPKEESNKEVQVQIQEIKDEPLKPLNDEDKKTILKWNIPTPPILTSIFSSINKTPISLPSLSSIGFPFQLPSIFKRPIIRYPGGYIEEVL